MCSLFLFSFLSHTVAPLPPTTVSEIPPVFRLACLLDMLSNLCRKSGRRGTHTLCRPFRTPSRGWFLTHTRNLYVKNRIPSNTPSCPSLREFLASKIDRVLIRSTELQVKHMKQFTIDPTETYWPFLLHAFWKVLQMSIQHLPVQTNLIFLLARNIVLEAESWVMSLKQEKFLWG